MKKKKKKKKGVQYSIKTCESAKNVKLHVLRIPELC